MTNEVGTQFQVFINPSKRADGTKAHGIGGERVQKGYLGGMKPKPIGHHGSGVAIKRVTQDRMADRGQMNAELMGTTGLRIQFKPAP